MKKISLAIISSLFLPVLASAATLEPDISKITPYSNGIINIINDILVPVIIAIAFISFLWGVYKYFIKGGTEAKEREEGRTYVMWSIIGFVVILSIWALVTLVSNVTGLTGTQAPKPPTFSPSGS